MRLGLELVLGDLLGMSVSSVVPVVESLVAVAVALGQPLDVEPFVELKLKVARGKGCRSFTQRYSLLMHRTFGTSDGLMSRVSGSEHPIDCQPLREKELTFELTRLRAVVLVRRCCSPRPC